MWFMPPRAPPWVQHESDAFLLQHGHGLRGSVRDIFGRACAEGTLRTTCSRSRVLLSVRSTLPWGGLGRWVWQNLRVGGCPTPPPPEGGVGRCGGPWVYRASASSFFLLMQGLSPAVMMTTRLT